MIKDASRGILYNDLYSFRIKLFPTEKFCSLAFIT